MKKDGTEYEHGSKRVVSTKSIYILFGLLIFLTITMIALAAGILGVVVNRLDSKTTTSPSTSPSTSPTTSSTTSPDITGSLSLVDQIKIDDLMKHLGQLQVFADRSNGTRVIATSGFNDTLDYITTQLEQNTNLIIQHQYFTFRNFIIQGTPQLQTRINGSIVNQNYSDSFTHILFSSLAAFDSFVPVVVIPNAGCTDADWTSVSATNAVALVIRGVCNYVDKSILAEKYQVRGLLIYNNGTGPNGMQPITGIRNNMNTTIPAFFLSYNLGMQLVNATSNADVIMNINVSDALGIGNICADTPTGDNTKTIVIGSHSDSVAAGSGINDNGSGSVGNLVLALNLARLFQTSSANYAPYPYRVRFCWWGAEEHGLIGSIYHVDQASLPTTTTIGERLQDYLVNLNYDMLAGPNYRFGIHDSALVPATTPASALNGTSRITDLFRQWFNEQNLPWSNASLGGGSDYVPFLAAGIAVGGVNTGAGGIKSSTERDQYSAVLGTGNGGLANAAFDPCYHQQCDRITNINPFAYEKVVKAAAYTIEYLGRLNDLEKWLYPQGRTKIVGLINRSYLHDSRHDSDLI